METERLNFLLIQETKLRADELVLDIKMEGYEHHVLEGSTGEKKGGGLLTYWKDSITARIWKPQGNYIDEKVVNERMWLLVEGEEIMALANIYLAP